MIGDAASRMTYQLFLPFTTLVPVEKSCSAPLFKGGSVGDFVDGVPFIMSCRLFLLTWPRLVPV